MLYATIRALGSLPSVALSSPMAVVLYPFMLEGETLWLNQAALAKLYQTTKQNVSLHIQNIYYEGELSEDVTVKDYLTVQTEGGRQVNRQVKHYNLDMIISVGYRIKSNIATRFRQWATQRLREYIVKGFVLDDERLKNPDQPFDYFDELLRRIQESLTENESPTETGRTAILIKPSK